jgi:hypothetical protein
MLSKAYQGRNVFYNCSDYSEKTLAALGTRYYEHASIHEKASAILSSVKHGLTFISREFRVHEVQL